MKDPICEQVCYNLCDPSPLSKLILDCQDSRIYLGSYGCCRKLISLRQNILNRLENKDITVVVPIVSEKYLNQVRDIISACGEYAKAEVVVNDISALRMAQHHSIDKIILGRNMSRDKRDVGTPNKKWVVPYILTKHYLKFLEDYPISGIELEKFHPNIDVGNCPKSIQICIHDSLVHITNGNICELSSIDKPISEKFRPSPDCREECRTNAIFYNNGHEYYKLGNEVFSTACTPFKLRGVKRYRNIITPIEVRPCIS